MKPASTIFLFCTILIAIISTVTYFKTRKIYEAWSTNSIGGNYDANYIGGLGWGAGFGDWIGKPDTPLPTTPKGWSVSWNGNQVGSVGFDQVFHKTSLEGEFTNKLDSPLPEDTINRLGGGWTTALIHGKPTINIGGNMITSGGNTLAGNAQNDLNDQLNGDLTFYAPGTFLYGADNYIPSYSSSVLLSPMLGVNAPIKRSKTTAGATGDSTSQTTDICSPDSGYSVLDKEEYCRNLSTAEAANAACCILMGGKYPMAGHEQGPYNMSAYTDPTLQGATDYYIYMSKCYGNCPGSNGL